MRCDVLVVGAGPAGASAARAAARGGTDVLLVERSGAVGVPVQCAEFVPALFARETALGDGCVARKVQVMKVFGPRGPYETRAPGFVLNRAVFEKYLVNAAARDGARVMLATTFQGNQDGKAVLMQGRRTITAAAKVIVGADGPRSAVGHAVGIVNREFAVGLQYELPLAAPMGWTEVHFLQGLADGYSWVFPKTATANVGVAAKAGFPRGSLKKTLEEFARRLSDEGKVFREPVGVTGGLIPVGGPLPTVAGNVVLVGDAAGQTHAITGGGIPQAVICGRVAGEAAARAVRDGLKYLREYEAAWRELYGAELTRAAERRREMETRPDNLTGNFKKYWVTFPEYYE